MMEDKVECDGIHCFSVGYHKGCNDALMSSVLFLLQNIGITSQW